MSHTVSLTGGGYSGSRSRVNYINVSGWKLVEVIELQEV